MRLPALNGLRAFEAVARHLSMKHAAEELSVTASAVSQLVRSLELELGAPLFVRGHRSLALSAAGQALHPAVRSAFDLLVATTDRVRLEPDGGLLRISTTTFFAETWLMPRLADFQHRHPGIDVHVGTSISLANLHAGAADLAIRHGAGGYPGMVCDLIVSPPVIPVASTKLVAERGFPTSSEKLLHWPRLQDADRVAWGLWFTRQGVAAVPTIRGPSFDDASLLLSSVLSGHGAALLPQGLVVPLIEDGTLVALGTSSTITELAYWLVTPRSSMTCAKVEAFRNWVTGQVEKPDHA